MTVDNPDTGGNDILASTLTSSAAGSNCASGNTDARCANTVTVSSLSISNVGSPVTTTPGGVVRYTAVFTNTGQTPYNGILVQTDATDVFDDASPNGDQTATSGTLVLTSSGISWTGNIPVGGSVTITGTVTVNNPDTGNKVLTSTLVTAAPGSNCASGSTDPACTATVQVQVPGLTITNTPSTSTTTPGSTVGYTVTIADTGQTSYTGISVADDLTGIFGDAVYNGDAAATAGAVSYTSPTLTWTGNITPGNTVTVTFSITVNNPDTGGKVLVTTVTSSATGSTCPAGTNAAACQPTVAVLTPGLSITSTAGSSTTTPGATVSYTVTITDSGETPYSGITVADNLTGVLDDAAYNSNASVSAGAVSYTSPTLTWTGSLNPGNSATVTFSVTVNNPDTGDKTLSTTVTTAAVGSNCPSGSTDPNCATSVPVSVLTIVNSASVTTVTPGGTVDYTVTVTNSGQVTVSNGTLTIPLSDVIDDAVYNGDAAATAGTVSYTSPNLTWTGTLATQASATITFSATVNDPDTGNKTLQDTITSTTPGSTCPASGTAPAACTTAVSVLVPGLTISTTASSSTTTPGSAVQYTITVADTGQTSYTGVAVTDDLTNILNDSVYNGDAAATTGSVAYASPTLTWTGNLAPGDTATITFSVTVDNPDNGDKHLTNTVVSTAQGSTCPSGSTNPACTAAVTDLIPGLTITKTANVASATPGSAVDYTITVADTGQTSYTGAAVTDDLTGVLGAAAYNSDAAATTGSVAYASPTLTWTGNLAPGGTATVTYSVTIDNPETGGTSMTNTVTSTVAGSTCPTSSTGGQCTVTTGIISGPLTMTAPASADLGSGAPGSTVQGSLGTVQVTDGRGFGADWTATVSSSDFSAGGPTETIPVSDATYAITSLTTETGPATFGYVPQVGLSQNAQNVVSATNVNGNTAVSWNPVIHVAVPGGAVGGTYSATIVHSVS